VAIRRRRKKLTSLVSRLDERVRSVELRPINLLTSDQVEAAVEIGETLLTPTNVVSASAPNQFFKVEDAYYYSKELTGNSEDRVSIYLETDLQLPVGGSLEISGIHGTNTNDVDVSGVFEVKFADSEPWTDRASWKHDPTQDQLPTVTITNEYSIKPDTLGPATWGDTYRRLQTKRLVDTFSITGNTVTLTMNAVHKFKVDDVVYVDIFAEDSRAFGADGLFKITAVTSNTIEYELAAGVDTPTGEITPSADFYVYPVARNHLPVGSTWSDSSTNKIYVWDGIRWVDYSAVDIQGDDDPPNAPTNLQIESELKFFQTTVPVVEVTVEWDPPVTSESGDPLTDLLGYTIKYRSSSAEAWEVRDLPFTDTSYTFKAAADFLPDTTYSFEVYAYDSGNLYSQALTGSHTTPSAPASNILSVRPTPPSIEVYLGTFTITWDGTVEDTSENPQTKPDGLTSLDIHISTSPSFTPNDSTRVSTIAPVAGAKYVYAEVAYGSSYYIKLVLRDASNTSTLPSRETSATAQSTVDASRISGIIAAANITPGTIVTGEKIIGLSITGQLIEGNEINGDVIKANSIEADRIQAGAITAKIVDGEVITTNNSDSGSRVRLSDVGIEAYNGTTRTFFLDASSGDVTIGGYATDGQLDAVSTTASNANTTANTANTTTNSIYSNIYFPGTTQIDGDVIRTGTIEADRIKSNTITSTQISSDYIYAGSITADQVSAGTFVGSSFKTASGTNKRVLVSGSSNTVKFYQDGNGDLSPRATLEGDNNGMYVRGPNDSTSDYFFVSAFSTRMAQGGNVLTVTSSGLGMNVIESDTISYSDLRYNQNTGSFFILGSDRRLKTNITTLQSALQTVNKLNPVSFKSKYSSSDETNHGFIAQEIEEVLGEESKSMVGKVNSPSIVGYTGDSSEFENDPLRTFSSSSIVPLLTKAIQELSQKNDELQTRLEALEGN